MKVKKKIKFIDCASEVPIVKFILGNGEEAYAVLDTGSEVTLIDYKLAFGENKHDFPVSKSKSKMTFVGIHKDTEAPIVTTTTTLRFNDADDKSDYVYINIKDAMLMSLTSISQHLHDQYGTKITVSALLGSDILTKLNAEINYKSKELQINYDLSS